VIVALDKIAQLRDQRILYDPLRNGCELVCIANDEKALMNLDPRIRSLLQLEETAFLAYRDWELFDILWDRGKLALMPDTIERRQVRVIASFSNSDARVGLKIMRRAALLAEDEGQIENRGRAHKAYLGAGQIPEEGQVTREAERAREAPLQTHRGLWGDSLRRALQGLPFASRVSSHRESLQKVHGALGQVRAGEGQGRGEMENLL